MILENTYRAQDLAPLNCRVIVRVEDLPIECALHDISEKGVAFEWPAAVSIPVGAALSDLEVRIDGHVAFRGAARIGSVREQDGATLVGVSFAELLDVEEVQPLRIVKGWFPGKRPV